MSRSSRAPQFDFDRIRAATSRKQFWSSIDELLDEQGLREWIEAEFPAPLSVHDKPRRRQFLKLIGASLLLGGLTRCGDRPANHALPYVIQPEEEVPGVPRYYATAVAFEGYAQPVVATTYSGRPIKLDGNPDHPVTRGTSDVFMQSAVLDLYDPERSKIPLRNGAPASWAQFETALSGLRESWRNRKGEGLRILTGATTSPTLIRQFRAMQEAYPNMRWSRCEAIGHAQQDEAMSAAFGRVLTPHYRLDQCDVVVSLDHDVLGAGPRQVAHAQAWGVRHGEVQSGLGRMRVHVAESVPSLTGTVASTRIPVDPSRIEALTHAMAAEFKVSGFARPDLQPGEGNWLDRALRELRNSAGHSLLMIGPYCDPHLQALAPAINAQLGNVGKTVWYSEPAHVPDATQPLAELTREIANGAIETVVFIGCNPVYTCPGPLGLANQLARVPNRIHAGLHADETAALCQWHLPLSHALESWSDARAVDGTATIMQPVIAPLYSSRSAHQIVDMLLGSGANAANAAVRETWEQSFGEDFDRKWIRSLHDGFVDNSGATAIAVTPNSLVPTQTSSGTNLEVVFRPDPCIWDGRFSNVAWLQELPKPLTKITWDNVIEISPALANEHSVSNGDVVEVSIDGRKIRGAAWVIPGQAPRTVALYFGYGRRGGAEIAIGAGYDAFSIRPNEAAWKATGSISRQRGHRLIATTQAHHRMDGFDFVREVSAKNPRLPTQQKAPTFYPDWNVEKSSEKNSPDHAWGMVIDLDLCVGCNACVSACNVENNVLVVGKDQVSRGREMLWLRVDRYFTGDVDNPRAYFQPVPCMHCEKAPCEMGCPVHATVHSPEGVNQMVYNRCIGTRTCSSYCPYKVRRFNWYDYRHFEAAEEAAKNPDVTVRSRGVMEKCTYCTQRIQAAHVQADKENRSFRRDEVVTACQQACPTRAIVFGDLKDEDSAVSKRRRSGRHYVLLEELGTRPRTTYLARWNDSPDEEK
ncbi:MAG TPA: TAT-variant-translocated molybdopterin oxidoreductase [Pseudolabrys sp.]|nr:TAT-variant-translocated molybdopterin oxidoreductase [Pseudolabrys sp.]